MIHKLKERKKGTIVPRRSTPKVGDILEVEFYDGTTSLFVTVGDTRSVSCGVCDGNLEGLRCIAHIGNFSCPGSIKFKSIEKVMEGL